MTPAPASDFRTRWAAVAIVVGCGVVAAMQVGKAAIAGPMLQSDLGLNLDALGWLTGIFAVLGVVGGIPAGVVIGSVGGRRALVGGLLATAVGAAVGAASPVYGWLLASRVIEGAGFLFITVAGPAVLQRQDMVRADRRDLAFALWSCFMPAGMAIAMLVGPLLGGWRSLWWACCGLVVAAAVAVLATVPGDGPRAPLGWRAARRDAARVARARHPLLPAAVFACYSLMVVAVLNILGNLAAGHLLARGVARPLVLCTASVAMGAAALGIFLPLLPDAGVFLLCVVFSAVGGLIPATLLSSAPLAAPAAALTPIVVGLVMQGNNLGQIVGPIAMGGAIDAYGWHAAAWVVAAAALLAAASAAALPGAPICAPAKLPGLKTAT